MISGDPTPRLFAAAAALTGTAVLMYRSEPSREGVLIGLSCLALWALGTLASKPGKPLPLTKPARPMGLKTVIVETPRTPQLLLPAPGPAERREVLGLPAALPEVPTHRQRVIERHTGRGR
ncbi:energy transducer TonB [Methylobacterium sp. NEAU K]|uniref:energy transducer TonB n=1 Tax=Methylobacterium sp. NEAU K TaxID=3064946 RepID=UPI002735DF79|nr:energy transducer TonB [Methylobacterium sp. NEAU K]MDP4006915.1 energy transducer TonB [Methylobacterium sp. NEAU K]